MRLRQSVRALIMDPDDHILLVRFQGVGFERADGFWANPGGGTESGETRLEALQRELGEEVGLEVDELGPEVWTKTALFDLPGWDGQVDHIHLIRTDRFEARPRLTPEQLRAESVHEVRWWAPEELQRSEAVFAPRSLPHLVRMLLDEGLPDEPVVLHGF